MLDGCATSFRTARGPALLGLSLGPEVGRRTDSQGQTPGEAGESARAGQAPLHSWALRDEEESTKDCAEGLLIASLVQAVRKPQDKEIASWPSGQTSSDNKTLTK